MHKWYIGNMSPYYPNQENFARNVFSLAGILSMVGVSTSKCEDKPSSNGIKAGSAPKDEVYYAADHGNYRVNLVLSTHLPINKVSLQFLKIDPSKSNYQKIDLNSIDEASVRAVFPRAKIITFTHEGYKPSVRGLELLTSCTIKIDDPVTQSNLAAELRKAVALMTTL